VRIATGQASKIAKIKSVTAAGIEHVVTRRCPSNFRDRVEQRFGGAAIMQSPPRRSSRRCIAWVLGTAILRLEQVDVSAASSIKRVPARATQPPLLAR